MKRLLLALLACVTMTTFAQRPWVTAYQSNWASSEMPLNVYEWDGITHLIHFNIEPSRTAPYYYFPQGRNIFECASWGNCEGNAYQRALIDSAHANGVKVILCIGGIGNDNQATYAWFAQDSVRLETAMRSILGYAQSRGYDGVDFDIEGWNHPTAEEWTRLVRFTHRILQEWSPRGLLTMAGGRDHSNNIYPAWVINTYFDQVNAMNYDCNGYWSSGTGFHAPLYNPSPNYPWYPSESGALNTHSMIQTYLNNGVLPSKIGLGLATYGWGWTRVSQPGVRTSTIPSPFNNYYVWYHEIVTDYIEGRGLVPNYDTLAEQPWIANPNGSGWNYINYDDERSLRKKVEYAKNRGFGGVMVFSYNSGYIRSKPRGQRFPLMKAIANSVTSVEPEAAEIPTEYRLQAYPNPFNPALSVEITLPKSGETVVEVYNVLGMHVVTLYNGYLEGGKAKFIWNAVSNPSGTYFVRASHGSRVLTSRVVLLK